ncbi:hypothetical protein KUCAC02_017732 [Chaenocephalus aceratus]|uniref:Uncharacterized protein n=1 Tax=Chaenocephalus aceratus TaxID=36190 RepID=A0ACB9W2N8_CHAAC|nr:hypothetical protein KUCAC02_017732 [Chaenocephalus aceratus]
MTWSNTSVLEKSLKPIPKRCMPSREQCTVAPGSVLFPRGSGPPQAAPPLTSLRCIREARHGPIGVHLPLVLLPTRGEWSRQRQVAAAPAWWTYPSHSSTMPDRGKRRRVDAVTYTGSSI